MVLVEDVLILLMMIEECWYRRQINPNTTALATKMGNNTHTVVVESRPTMAIRKWAMTMSDAQSSTGINTIDTTAVGKQYIFSYYVIIVFNRLDIITFATRLATSGNVDISSMERN